MIPRGLTARVFTSFLALSILATALLAGGLFLVLRDLHRAQAEAELGGLLPALVATARDPGVTDERSLLEELRDLVPADATLAVVTAKGKIITLGGTAPVELVPITAGSGPIRAGSLDVPAGRYTYGTMTLAAAGRPASAPRFNGHLVVLLPDMSGPAAARDLARTSVFVFLLVILAALPLAYLLARSIGRPLKRLAAATAAVPRDASVRVPESGPAEVRELSVNFNTMAEEIGTARAREAELLVNLRHDLRTPLTVIGGFAEAIRDGTVTGERAHAAADTIVTETARLANLVRQLGDTGLETPVLLPEVIDLVAALAATQARFRAQAAAAGAALSLAAASADTPLVWADRTALDRILGNLLENALAAVKPGGHIRLAARSVNRESRAGATFTVTDDGPGFSPEALARAFDRFWRGDQARTGGSSGLGLAIVRELARAQIGEAWVENVAGGGARVSVWLPALQ